MIAFGKKLKEPEASSVLNMIAFGKKLKLSEAYLQLFMFDVLVCPSNAYTQV